MDQDEITAEVERCIRIGLAALGKDHDQAADEAFRRAVHVCADAARVVREIVRQSGGQL